jgi:hypothetical protein
MPQKTNLNINPYYDDFDKDDNFYRVLFKPGFPVQARELTTLQSILQNQVESFGSHVFKEGSMVIPGNINYDDEYYSVKINDQHLGIDVSVYADKLVGKRVRGQTTQIVAVVDKYLPTSTADGTTDFTLFVKYLRSGTNNEVSYFDNGETLIVEESFTYGNTTVNAGDTVASLVSQDACARGSSVSIGAGVYFIRGSFVNVAASKLVLDPYTNSPSYRVGLTILEELVNAKDDNSLYDNAKGFSNFAAPGADRLKITTTLSKKSLTDYNDTSFVELIQLQDGVIRKLQDKSQYSIIKDYFAKRTYEESGDYSVGEFDVTVKESLNNGLSNQGVYTSSQKTEGGKVPSDDLLSVKVSAGKAYVRGYDIESVSTTILDADKPRDTQNVSSSLVPFEFGTKIKLKNVFGTPFVGVNNNYTIKLFSQRKSSNTAGTGVEIGEARVYSFGVSDAPYSNAATDWDLYLFDVQTHTILTVNSSLTSSQCPATSFVRGVSSGASGYVVTAASGTTLTLTQTSGTFIAGEQIIINESSDLSRSIVSTKVYGIQDVKSVYQDTSVLTGFSVDFVADVDLQKSLPKSFSITDTIRITAESSGVSTVTSPGNNFVGIKTDSILRYQISGLSTETFNRVSSVSADGLSMTVASVPSVTDVCSGSLPTSTETVTFSIGNPLVKENGGLYSKIESDNVSSVSLSNSNLVVSKQITGKTTAADGTLTLTSSDTGITSSFYETFDAERYGVFYQSDGSVEDLTSDQFTLSSGGDSISLTGLTPSASVVVNTTLKKNKIRNKKKEYVRSESINISNTSSGVSTSTSGLTQNSYYGLRVEDKEISLNLPDVAKVIAVYESYDSNAITLDSLEFPSGLGLDTNSVLGEKITGRTSGAIAQIVTRSSATVVEFVYLNSNKFSVGEIVDFEESNISSSIQVITIGNYQNITDNYTLDKGQREHYYDYSRIVRKNNSYVPSHRLKVIFDYYSIPTSDTGDVYTVNSYDEERFAEDIPALEDNVRASDTLDFRPRVARFVSSSSSPFAFANRNFSTAAINPTLVVAPQESSLIGYDFYLPRIDKVVLNKEGKFSLIKGVSSINPKEPLNVEEAMDIATIEYPAYVYNADDVKVSVADNRRYTMRDIGKIEDRVSNLEALTSLSLLEVNTKTLQIRDVDGLDRFKSGFFVDDFKDVERSDRDLSKFDVDVENNVLLSQGDTHNLKPIVALNSSLNQSTADLNTNLALLDSNVQKTGDLITLKYSEVSWKTQAFASRVENVNPFNMVEYVGNLQLTPSSDSWVRTIYVDGGTRQQTGSFDGSYTETVKTSSVRDPFIRESNVSYSVTGLKAFTRYYPFFDNTSGIDIVPKLIEITMTSGVFNIGERVRGFVGSSNLFNARVAQPNHKSGTFNSPSTTYSSNPYNTSIELPTSYSASSTVLNVDHSSLADRSDGRFGGYLTAGMVLIGETSGAQATVSNVRVITDLNGSALGTFFIRNPLSSPVPPLRFSTGTSTFKLTSSATNAEPLPGSLLISSGETTYSTSGRIDTFRQTRVIVRRPPPPPPRRVDPLAQSFTTDTDNGLFLTSVDLYFASKDTVEDLIVELRTVELGTPTSQLVEDYASVSVSPSQITTSTDASVKTTVSFPSPIYLQPNTEYALVLLSPASDNYEVWIARMGEVTIETSTLPDAETIKVGQQYTGGSLFKSQNGTIWTASQFEDLKFTLNRASFSSTSGTAYFYNPDLDNDKDVVRLTADPVKTLPRKLRVGITTTTTLNDVLVIGRKVSDTTSATGPYGYIEQVGGRVSTLSNTLVGAGYSDGTFTGVPLYSITGSGTGATGVVTFSSGQLTGTPSITNVGSGYVVGDVLGITTSNVSKGSGAQITVSALNGFDTLYLTNVQGQEFTSSQDLVVYDGATAVSYANTDITSSATISDLYDGRVIEVTQNNHGMHADNNLVTLANIEPNTIPTSLNAAIGSGATTISVANTSIFTTFEGISTSTGYVKIDNEIIFYNSVTAGASPAGTLGIGTRGVDSSLTSTHAIGTKVYPYQLNGVSLTRINTNHNIPTNSTLKSAVDLDKYYLQIGRADRASGDSQLSFTDQNVVGGNGATGSKNVQFNSVIPDLSVITPGENTTISAQIRTVSGTSASGSEVSFTDQGFESVEIGQVNNLSSTRIVASNISETTRLEDLPRNKSFTLGVEMNGSERLSPVIDISTSNITFIRDRLNRPVDDYVTQDGANSINSDPHEAIYVSQRVNLKQPATSLKVLVSAYRHSSADFRVLYELFRVDSSAIEQSFELFPGYDNLTDTDGDGFGDKVIDSTKNSGRADAFVPASKDGEFLEYQFSVDELEQFNGFRIKIVSSGTNEAYAPRYKDLRVIALA